jgi:hypothetical protein
MIAAAVTALTLTATTQAAPSTTAPPATVIAAALCIHDGYHYATHWQPGTHLTYTLYGHGFWRTTKTWSNGEGSWTGTVGSLYGGGLSFTLGTWNRAGAPYASSVQAIAQASPTEQIRRLVLIVAGDGGSYREWPTTGRACNLPM